MDNCDNRKPFIENAQNDFQSDQKEFESNFTQTRACLLYTSDAADEQCMV
jgi:hypothetical protein